MQDDVCLIVAGGGRAAAQPRLLVEEKGKKSKDKPDFSVGKRKYKTELPSSLLVARYFAKEQAEIERLEADAAAVGQTLEELVEEHCGEDGILDWRKPMTRIPPLHRQFVLLPVPIELFKETRDAFHGPCLSADLSSSSPRAGA